MIISLYHNVRIIGNEKYFCPNSEIFSAPLPCSSATVELLSNFPILHFLIQAEPNRADNSEQRISGQYFNKKKNSDRLSQLATFYSIDSKKKQTSISHFQKISNNNILYFPFRK